MTEETTRERSLGTLAMLSLMKLVENTRELLEELEQQIRPPGDKALQRLEQGYAIADVLALAVFADGEVSKAEWAALASACSRIRRGGVEAQEAVRYWKARTAEIQNEEQLLIQVRSAAAVLEDWQRKSVFRHVELLSQNGAGVPSGEASYRDFRSVDPEALLDVFAEGLGVVR